MQVFSILKNGISFDKKRFSQDHKLFSEKQKPQESVQVDSQLSGELDFFKIHDTPVQTPKEIPKPAKPLKKLENSLKDQKIKTSGSDVPEPIQSFEELQEKYNLLKFLSRNLSENGYSEPTAIQRQSIPIMLSNRDLIACAPTGSGKTLAFSIPILQDLKAPEKIGFRAVIVSPTRELAMQIHREMSKLCQGRKFKICVLSKKLNMDSDQSQYKNFDILIATPLRLVNALQMKAISLENTRHLVLDEADRLLELGFLEQIDEILASCTNNRLQKTLFSATIPSGVEELAKTFMLDPIRVIVGQKNAATETIEQKLVFVGSEEGKMIAVRQMIQQGISPPVLVFVQSIERAKELFHELVYDNINVDVIHSERTRAQRDNIVYNFRTGKIWVLIATELMARGIDFKGVNLVVNYDFPQSAASYIHRIGRTGRAGQSGQAITFFTKQDAPYLKTIVNVMRDSGCQVPEWMLQLKKPSKNMKKNLKQHAPKRATIKTSAKYDENKRKHKNQIVQESKKRKLAE